MGFDGTGTQHPRKAHRGAPRPRKDERPSCGARCRDGHPCRALAVWLPGDSAPRNGRCRMHGGLSTGPRTPEGKAAIAESNRRRWARWRTERRS